MHICAYVMGRMKRIDVAGIVVKGDRSAVGQTQRVLSDFADIIVRCI